MHFSVPSPSVVGLTFFTLCAVYYLGSLARNIRKAQKIGLPYTVNPTSVWVVVDSLLFTSRLFCYIVDNWLPPSIADNLNASASFQRWKVKDRLVRRLGGCYVTVRPFSITVDVSDADVIHQITSNRFQFPKPLRQYAVLLMYGPNIVATDGKEWLRHRHHASPAFNEKNNLLVWREAISQTLGMLEEWRKFAGAGKDSFVVKLPRTYIHKLILQVLASAAFGVVLPYTVTSEEAGPDRTRSTFADHAEPPPGFRSTFRSVTEFMSQNFTSIFFAVSLMPRWVPRFLVPFLKPHFEAYEDLEKYLTCLLQAAKENNSNDQESNNLTRLLVKSNEDATKETYRLSAKELIGNMHVFTFAGFETTANALRFTLVLLALHPEKQKWMRQGIKEALQGQPEDPREWQYTEVYPKLVAPLCVMMETLRLFAPVVSVPKSTGSSPSSIVVDGKPYILPLNTDINLNCDVAHHRRDYWGPDAFSFVPERWDARNTESFLAKNEGLSGLVAPGLEYNTLHKPIRGSYLPFSDGYRACLGKKFAQVEFVAALAVIFRDYEVTPAKVSPGESDEEAMKRALKILNNTVSILTLGMVDDAPLCFRRVK
ncbi:hypothetical protein VTO42DRAFT_8754 [Malbranchea cinnamomea]